MACGIRTAGGESVSVTVPTRYYAGQPDGRRFSLSAAADFLSDAGFDGADLSLELVDGLDGRLGDDWRSVLYSFGNRAAARGLTLPMCHLPFYMPDPDDGAAMARFSRAVAGGLHAAAMLHIPDAVIHPIVRHSSRRCRDSWRSENLAYLSPLRELAGRLGVRLCIENMAGRAYPTAPDEAIFGSRAADIRELADALDTGVCWDFGHANLSGLCQSAELELLHGRLCAIHIHDNDGRTDTHRIPGDCPASAAVDWQDAAEGLRLADFLSTSNRCLDMELKTSDLSSDSGTRLAYAVRTLAAAKALAERI